MYVRKHYEQSTKKVNKKIKKRKDEANPQKSM